VLHEPDRHEPLAPIAWDAALAHAAIARIVRDAEDRFCSEHYWPPHPLDVEPADDPDVAPTSLYWGATGVLWALDHLRSVGAVSLRRDPLAELDTLLARHHVWLAANGIDNHASYLSGDTPILMMAFGREPSPELGDRLAGLIEGHLDHPARELMLGSPGTLLAALFLHERTAEQRWAALFRFGAERLWAQLEWSAEHACHFWTQQIFGTRCSYLDAVHGFVGNAKVLIRGRHLLGEAWPGWQHCIETTVQRTAAWEGDCASWRDELHVPPARRIKKLMQYCHGAPGFVICPADLPGTGLDDLLLAGGRATWAAGPLTKGSNLCHGTGGNGYAFLKLYRRTGDAVWLDRARAFAMHGIAQTDADRARFGQGRYSLWTGDIGFAIYLWDCIRGTARFPTLDVF
jgi:Lanthionine synthetase C-like protein